MVAINAAAYELLRHAYHERRLHRVSLAAFVAWLVGVPLYGTIRLRQVDAMIEASPKRTFGVVQGNFGIMTYLNGNKLRLLADLQRESARLEREGAEVLLWGETAYPFITFTRDKKRDLPMRDLRRVRRGFTRPLVMGLVTVDSGPDGSPYPWNSAAVLNPDDTVDGYYDKNFPLWFGEYVPLVDPEWYLSMVPSASYLNIGDGPRILTLPDGIRLGPLICYEDILPRFVRDVAREDIHVLVNLTNDSWFGRTREQGEHLGLAIFRTIEQRRAMLRSVNAGPSAYVDPAGRVFHRSEVTDSDEEGYRGP